MLGDDINTFHQDTAFAGQYFQHFPSLIFIISRQHLNGITFADVQLLLLVEFPFHNYNTSGANEMIFMNCFSRSSRATGPKIRVPLGSSWAVNNTAALSSKRMYEPSFLRTSFLVRTITALLTVPFLIWLVGNADFTVTTILSPTLAERLCVPPNTWRQSTSLAPLLSATVSLLSVEIMITSLFQLFLPI